MMEDVRGAIDYEESGNGPPVVLVPGSCSTGAAWRPIIATWDGKFRCITTSLMGYGGTTERRTAGQASIEQVAEIVETVLRRAGGHPHLVGHSFGGLVALAVALRGKVPLASVAIIEAPAAELLRDRHEQEHYQAFRRMTDAYFADYSAGNAAAIAGMVDFYGGAGTFRSWPERVRAYAIETTPANILDWSCAYGFALSAAMLAQIRIPALVLRGGSSHAAVQRANGLLGELIPGARLETIAGAAHFMIATHAGKVGRALAEHVRRAQLPGDPRARESSDLQSRLIPQSPCPSSERGCA